MAANNHYAAMTSLDPELKISCEGNLHIVSINQQILGTYQRLESGCFLCHVRERDFFTSLESMAISLIQIAWNQSHHSNIST